MRTLRLIFGSIFVALIVGCAGPQESHVKSTSVTSSAPAALNEVERNKAYAQKLNKFLQGFIVVLDRTTIRGSPVAEVEVRTAPDGAIIKTQLTVSSGSPVWDQAVLDGLRRAKHLPLDDDGRIPPVMVMTFRP